MEKEFVTYEQASALKELGFDKPCFAFYNNLELKRSLVRNFEECKNSDWDAVTSPLYQQAFRWFRENHGLMHIINPYYFTAEIDYLNERIVNKQYGDFIPHDHLLDEEGEEIKHSSYEEAESACLDKLIEIIKNKQD